MTWSVRSLKQPCSARCRRRLEAVALLLPDSSCCSKHGRTAVLCSPTWAASTALLADFTEAIR